MQLALIVQSFFKKEIDIRAEHAVFFARFRVIRCNSAHLCWNSVSTDAKCDNKKHLPINERCFGYYCSIAFSKRIFSCTLIRCSDALSQEFTLCFVEGCHKSSCALRNKSGDVLFFLLPVGMGSA